MSYTISTEPNARLRIDKWLWAARFFKTRSLAVDALGKGRVRVGGAVIKPAKEVHVGDLVEVDIEGLTWQVQVLGICEARTPASVARTLYQETSQGQVKRMAELERRRLYREPAAALNGRPTKRDRRIMNKLSN